MDTELYNYVYEMLERGIINFLQRNYINLLMFLLAFQTFGISATLSTYDTHNKGSISCPYIAIFYHFPVTEENYPTKQKK